MFQVSLVSSSVCAIEGAESVMRCSLTLNVCKTAFNNKWFMRPEMKEHKIMALCVHVCVE